jgi:hypothetical protein
MALCKCLFSFLQTRKEFQLCLDEKAAVGPQLVVFNEEFFIRSRKAVELCVCSTPRAAEAVFALLSVYYILELDYPGSYGQFLGFLQELALGETFPQKTKKVMKYLSMVLE